MRDDRGGKTMRPGPAAGFPAAKSPSIANVPNLLSATRLVGAFFIVAFAVLGLQGYLIPTFVGLMLTDWFDGKIAVRFHQQTAFGARLDSLADVSFYSAALLALAWLHPGLVLGEWGWLLPAAAAYLLNCLLGLARFGRIPTYHTRGAKIAWLLCTLSLLGVLGTGQGWPLRVGGAWVLLVNIEAILMTCVLTRSEVDVPSLYHAFQRRSAVAADSGQGEHRRPRTTRGE